MTATAFRLSATTWPAIAERLLEHEETWPLEAAIADLRWWTCRVAERLERALPSVETLRQRWRWSRDAVRELLSSTLWHDRTLPPPRRAGPARKRSIRQGRHGGTPGMRRSPSNAGRR